MTRRAATPEGAVLKACLQLLKLRGIPAWRQNQGALREGKRFVRFASAEGISDIVGCLPPPPDVAPELFGGRMLCVECKRPGGRLTAAQRRFLERMEAAGALCLVISDVAQLDAALRAEGAYGP
jgi:hypothetical protein